MFWRLIARLLARPFIAQMIVAFAKRTPYDHIYDDPATKKKLYMGRWWLLTERWWLPIAARVHHIVRRDLDREKHDHPVGFRTFIMLGEYIERDLMEREHWRYRGSTVSHSAEFFHQITYVAKDTYTLFIYWNWGPRNPWGFLKGDMFGVVKVPWQKYLDDKATREKVETDAQVAERVIEAKITAGRNVYIPNQQVFEGDASSSTAVRFGRTAGYDSRARTIDDHDGI